MIRSLVLLLTALVLAPFTLAQDRPFSSSHWLGRKAFQRILPLDRRSSCFTGLAGTGFAHLNDSIEAVGALSVRLGALWGDTVVTATGDPDAVLLLRDFFLSETSEGFGPIGIFRLNLRVFGKGGDGGFYEILRVDSTYRIPGNGFTVASFRFAQDLVYRLAADAATVRSAGAPRQTASYSLETVLHIDSVEKARLPAYTAPALRPGIYPTYADFAANTPKEAAVKMYPSKGGGHLAYNMDLPPDGSRPVKPGSVYAVATAGKVYKSTAYGFYELTKIGNEFFFAGWSARDLPFRVKVRGRGACGSVEMLYGPEVAERLYPVFTAAMKSGSNLYRIDHLRGQILPVLP